MASESAALLKLAESVADGVDVDWETATLHASDDERPVVRQLQVLASLSLLHRTLPTPPDAAQISVVSEKPPAAPAIGHWGHLSLRERLGGGTFGTVYRAWDAQLEREVAVKLLRGDSEGAGQSGERIMREARLLARVRHQNVVTVYGADTHEGRVGLWMELIEGTTLEQIVASGGVYSAREAALVGIDLCRALSAIHNAGLLHRDVKAQNVIREKGGRIVLMDFGTGREIASQPPAPGALAGTPLYLAPEVLDGAQATPATDLYSLGVLLYRLVTGEFPVRATTLDDLRREHAKGVEGRLRSARPDLPSAFVAVLERALARDPARRYDSAGAFEADLVRALETSGPMKPAEAATGVPTGQWWAGWRPWALAAAAIVLVGAAAIGWRALNRVPAATSTQIRSIAVLPLKNDSGDPSQEYFADGMTDEIISTLGRLDGLNVISHTSTEQFKGSGRTLPEIARVLNADGIVEGSVVVASDRASDGTVQGRKVRISARLIAAGTDTQIWGDTFEAVANDVVSLEGQFARAIADRIHLRLSPQRQATLPSAGQGTQNFDAFNLYLKGRAAWNLRTPDGLTEAIRYFDQAIALDDRFAAAYAGLADAYTLAGTYGAMPLAEANGRAFSAASRAVALDDTVAEAHASLGLVHDASLEWDAAERSFQRALSLQPGYANAHHWYSTHLMSRGRFDEATKSIQRAITLDPLSPSVGTSLGIILILSHRYDDAIAQLQKVIQTNDSYARAHRILGEAYAQKRDYDRGLAEIARASALGDTSAELRAYEGCILARAGRKAEAVRIVQELIDRYQKNNEGGPVGVAAVYVNLGDRDRAFEWLDRAVQVRDPWIAFLPVDPWFDGVRNDPRFASLLARTGSTR